MNGRDVTERAKKDNSIVLGRNYDILAYIIAQVLTSVKPCTAGAKNSICVACFYLLFIYNGGVLLAHVTKQK